MKPTDPHPPSRIPTTMAIDDQEFLRQLHRDFTDSLDEELELELDPDSSLNSSSE